ncbi:hypothetical protein FAS41_27350 [Pseudomonas nicosulfuronedens]|uniref:HTH luxR-type domain-containing protein n=1 Tax=Pseudomonas nicosulfuronedens TaxID=2571105 RepID=A0A5R9QM72_9PSED|nr:MULTISPECIES: LuxR C-terminal-related transcriptional regulator [Pseudomonas]TLX70628.1 hypothetical protein FAS41_27350 [Pseudomonas nicosulfuronedens]
MISRVATPPAPQSPADGAQRVTDDALLQSLYEGPIEAAPWRGFLRALRDRLDSGYANLAFHGLAGAPQHRQAIQDADWDCGRHERPYRDTYARLDPIDYLDMQPGTLYRLDDILAQAGPEGRRFHREFLRPAGMDQLVILHVAEPGGLRAWLTLARRHPARAYEPAELALMRALAPHLSSALKVFAVLAKGSVQQSVYRDALGHYGIGSLLLDGRCEVLEIDESARRIIAEHPALGIHGNRLKLTAAADDSALQALLEDALGDESASGCHAMRVAGMTPLELLARALHSPLRHVCQSSPALVLHLRSEARVSEALDYENPLMKLLGLTATEASLALRLAQGSSLVEAAQFLGLTEQTVRTYSKQIFAKTATRGQADLVRLVLSSVARLGAG